MHVTTKEVSKEGTHILTSVLESDELGLSEGKPEEDTGK